jgi:hypothetical protein
MFPPIDPVAQRAAYERQLALLTPVAQHLRVEVAPRVIVVDDEWTGPAAEAAAAFVAELDRLVSLAADGVEDLVRVVRGQLGALL